jgi:hypothetical protein
MVAESCAATLGIISLHLFFCGKRSFDDPTAFIGAPTGCAIGAVGAVGAVGANGVNEVNEVNGADTLADDSAFIETVGPIGSSIGATALLVD